MSQERFKRFQGVGTRCWYSAKVMVLVLGPVISERRFCALYASEAQVLRYLGQLRALYASESCLGTTVLRYLGQLGALYASRAHEHRSQSHGHAAFSTANCETREPGEPTPFTLIGFRS